MTKIDIYKNFGKQLYNATKCVDLTQNLISEVAYQGQVLKLSTYVYILKVVTDTLHMKVKGIKHMNHMGVLTLHTSDL